MIKKLKDFILEEDLVSQSMCDEIIECFQEKELEVSKIGTDKKSEENSSIRDSEVHFVEEPSEIHSKLDIFFKGMLRLYVEKILSRTPDTFLPHATYTPEGYQFLKYGKGGHYTWHSDTYGIPPDEENDRILSLVLYLNDDFEGGETEFMFTKVKPKKGKIIVFPSNICFVHRGKPVTSGEKYVIVTWAQPAHE